MLITEALLAFASRAILGAAIGWPASLAKPAAQQLGTIAANADAVTWASRVCLLCSVLIAPVKVMLADRVFGGFHRPVSVWVAVFAGLSTWARRIGILRWLTVRPELAAALDLVGTALLASMLRLSLHAPIKVAVAVVVTLLTLWIAAAGVWARRRPT